MTTWLTNFHPDAFQYNAATDTMVNTGIVVAGNHKTPGTPGVGNSTLPGRQWGIAPRIGIVWNRRHARSATQEGSRWRRPALRAAAAPFTRAFAVAHELPSAASVFREGAG